MIRGKCQLLLQHTSASHFCLPADVWLGRVDLELWCVNSMRNYWDIYYTLVKNVVCNLKMACFDKWKEKVVLQNKVAGEWQVKNCHFRHSMKQWLLELYLSLYSWRMGGRKRFWSQLNTSKLARDSRQWGANRNPLAGYRMGLSWPTTSPKSPKAGVEKSHKLQPNVWRSTQMNERRWTQYVRSWWWWPCLMSRRINGGILLFVAAFTFASFVLREHVPFYWSR